MAKKELNPGTIMGPLPVALVSVGDGDKTNIITVAWTGIVNTKPPMTYISVRPERYSYDMIRNSGEFVINLCSQNMTRRVDLCGMKTGAKGDKFKICGFEKVPAAKLKNCPMIGEAPVSLECKVVFEKELGSHTMFLAEIVNVHVDESLVDDKGKLDLAKADIIGYMHGEYVTKGKHLANFGFSVKKSPKTIQKNKK